MRLQTRRGGSAVRRTSRKLADSGTGQATARGRQRRHLRGKRNRPMLATLIGCGLRGPSCLGRRFNIELREEHWVIADLVGKGGHTRTVPTLSNLAHPQHTDYPIGGELVLLNDSRRNHYSPRDCSAASDLWCGSRSRMVAA